MYSLSAFALFEDKDVLVETARSDNVAKLRVSPGNAPDSTIMLALDLEGAYPLVRKKHLVGDLIRYLILVCIYCTRVL